MDFDPCDYDDGLEVCPHCMGLGEVNCHCGGDQCYCENHGEKMCPVCFGEAEVSQERAERYYAKQREYAEMMRKAMGDGPAR